MAMVSVYYRCAECNWKTKRKKLDQWDYQKKSRKGKFPSVSRCPSCDELRLFRETSHISKCTTSSFTPYVDTDITGKPVEITGPAMRDHLLSSLGLTMDRDSSVEKKRGNVRDAWEDDVELDQVHDYIREHGVPETVSEEEGLD